MNIIIAVCTYKRLVSLQRCLKSIQAIIIPENVIVNIVVIDNEPSQAVSEICQHHNITYIAENKRGLAFARNHILDYARLHKPDFLGIIDDDETMSKNWLIDMLSAFKETNADAIAGIIDIKLDDSMPCYLKKAYQFKKVTKITPTKTLPMGNVMLGKNIIDNDIVFDTRFNFTGGEDIDFFSRLYHQGQKLYKIPNAGVTEYLMPEKASLYAYFKRQMRVSKLHYSQKYPSISFMFASECLVSAFEIMLCITVFPLFLLNDTIKIKTTKICAKAIGRLLSRQSQDIKAYG